MKGVCGVSGACALPPACSSGNARGLFGGGRRRLELSVPLQKRDKSSRLNGFQALQSERSHSSRPLQLKPRVPPFARITFHADQGAGPHLSYKGSLSQAAGNQPLARPGLSKPRRTGQLQEPPLWPPARGLAHAGEGPAAEGCSGHTAGSRAVDTGC